MMFVFVIGLYICIIKTFGKFDIYPIDGKLGCKAHTVFQGNEYKL